MTRQVYMNINLVRKFQKSQTKFLNFHGQQRKRFLFYRKKSFFVVPKVSFLLEVLVLNFLNTGFLEKISLVVIEAIVTIVTIFVQFKNVTIVT